MQLVIIGEGGHSKVIKDLIRLDGNYTIAAILDDKYSELKEIEGIRYGPVSSAGEMVQCATDLKWIVAIGNNEVRKSIVDRLGLSSDSYISLIHPASVVSPSASIGRGTVVMANAVVQAEAAIGEHVIVNTGAIIEHDNCIDDYVHIAPRATLTGTVSIREGAMIGAGATVIPGKSIGEWAVVGAGSTVIRDIPAMCTAVGSPAKWTMFAQKS
ncbi:acetyltransferase [Paenibacillus sp. H1-7]|uniref:acetyltransferase n=1 Tax=Paenibacillus sp. H1-7 TaxID=2282849 RepID=UPI001EF9A68D|nr:acetyltransferase [Paenibacillus sp. H1-7]ULL13912.1 acetyltransferase [Paenibacillus sp. H1-7]